MEKDLSNPITEKCFSRFQNLRVLDLSRSKIEVVPENIGSFKHLRYLDVKVPNSIGKLQSLHTLRLNECMGIEELPKDMRYMISLRVLMLSAKLRALHENGFDHLRSLRFFVITNCENFEYLFEGIENLSSLHTLVIGNCKSLISLPYGLKSSTSLKHLVIGNCENLDMNMRSGLKGMGKEEEEDDDEYESQLRLQTLFIQEMPKLTALPQWLLALNRSTLCKD